MRPRLLLSSVLVLSLAVARAPVWAASTAPAPDLIVVDGHDWRVVLPATVLASRLRASDHPTPVVLRELDKERWLQLFLDRYAPRRPLLVQTPVSASAPLPPGLPAGAEPRRLVAESRALPLKLADEVRVPPPEDGSAPPHFLVGSDDLSHALLGTVLAGLEGGVLLPVGSRGIELEQALARARRLGAPVVWCGSPPEALTGGAAGDLEVEVLDEAALVRRSAQRLASARRPGDPVHLVITNPADTEGYFSPPHLSLLAPLYALGKNAALVLSGAEPEAIEAQVARFEADHGVQSHITLVGDYLALGMREMDDPDQVWHGKKKPRRFKLPLLAGLADLAPAEYAVGRLAAEDVHDLSLQVGRILAPERFGHAEPGTVLMLSNADLKFIMAEIISKATVRELENTGWSVDAYYGAHIDRKLIRKELPGKQIILWEGHPRDLTVDYEIGVVDQDLDASLVFLQGCYTLDRNDPYVLVQQGAASVVGTYMAVYSASGSAFAKAALDAMLYHGADHGQSLLHARNFLLAYVELKKRRGHREWRKTWRAGLSFDLWGDPTARPLPPAARPRVPPVRLLRRGDQLRFELPRPPWPRLQTGRYTLDQSPGAQLGSIYTQKRITWGDERRMQEVYFGWVHLPDFESAPTVTSSIPEKEWATVWAPRPRLLYLLVHNDAAETYGRAGLKFSLQR